MTSAKLKRFANGDRLILRCVKSTQPSQNRRAYGEVEDNIIIYIERLKT